MESWNNRDMTAGRGRRDVLLTMPGHLLQFFSPVIKRRNEMENLQEHRQEEHKFLRRDRCYLKMPCSRSALFTLNSKPGADLNSQGQKCLSSIVLSLRLIKHFDGFWGFYKLCSCFSRVQVDKCWCTHSAATAGEPPGSLPHATTRPDRGPCNAQGLSQTLNRAKRCSANSLFSGNLIT